MRRTLPLLYVLLSPPVALAAQERQVFTRADTLRGSNTPQRAWWDVTFYDLHVTDFEVIELGWQPGDQN